MKKSIVSTQLIDFIKDEKKLVGLDRSVISNLHVLVKMCIKEGVSDTAIGNYIFTVLSQEMYTDMPQLLDLLETLVIYAGHYTVSLCIEKLEHFLLSCFFGKGSFDLTRLLQITLTICNNHFHLLQLRFVQCIGILTTDLLYSDSKSYYKLKNNLLSIKNKHLVLTSIKILTSLLENGHCFIDRLDRLYDYTTEELQLDCVEQIELSDCIVNTISSVSKDHSATMNILNSIKHMESLCAAMTTISDKVLVCEIVEYIQEVVHEVPLNPLKRPIITSVIESKKIKLDVSKSTTEEYDPSVLQHLLTKFEKNEFELHIE